jgi:type IV pilus assembly protein PilE
MLGSRKIAGFSLIELMIALVIASLLATVALPAYRDHMIRSAIPQATGGLSLFAMRMEEYYQDHRTYANGTNCGAAINPPITIQIIKFMLSLQLNPRETARLAVPI